MKKQSLKILEAFNFRALQRDDPELFEEMTLADEEREVIQGWARNRSQQSSGNTVEEIAANSFFAGRIQAFSALRNYRVSIDFSIDELAEYINYLKENR